MEQSPARSPLPRLTTVMRFLLACGRQTFFTAPAAAAAGSHDGWLVRYATTDAAPSRPAAFILEARGDYSLRVGER